MLFLPIQIGIHRWDNNERQQCCADQPGHYSNGYRCPDLRALPQSEGHRQKTQNGGCSRHQDGAEVDRAGLHNRIHLLNSCCAQVVYIIDKNNCIIYHDARQHNQTKEDHNAQGNACEKRPGSDTCRAQYDSRVVPDQNEVCTFLAISRYPMAGDDSGREMVIGVPWSHLF